MQCSEKGCSAGEGCTSQITCSTQIVSNRSLTAASQVSGLMETCPEWLNFQPINLVAATEDGSCKIL